MTAETPQQLFEQKFSCSQAVLAGLGPKYGLDRETAMRLGRTFGSGVGMGMCCGAVNAAFMVIGLSFGAVDDERKTRYESYDLAREFVRRFKAAHGSIDCIDLLGVDLGTEEGRRQAEEKNLFWTVCPRFVDQATRILEDILP